MQHGDVAVGGGARTVQAKISYHNCSGLNTLLLCLLAAVLSVDRAVCLRYPLQRLTVCVRGKALVATGVVAGAAVLIYLPSVVVGMAAKFPQGETTRGGCSSGVPVDRHLFVGEGTRRTGHLEAVYCGSAKIRGWI